MSGQFNWIVEKKRPGEDWEAAENQWGFLGGSTRDKAREQRDLLKEYESSWGEHNKYRIVRYSRGL